MANDEQQDSSTDKAYGHFSSKRKYFSQLNNNSNRKKWKIVGKEQKWDFQLWAKKKWEDIKMERLGNIAVEKRPI